MKSLRIYGIRTDKNTFALSGYSVISDDGIQRNDMQTVMAVLALRAMPTSPETCNGSHFCASDGGHFLTSDGERIRLNVAFSAADGYFLTSEKGKNTNINNKA